MVILESFIKSLTDWDNKVEDELGSKRATELNGLVSIIRIKLGKLEEEDKDERFSKNELALRIEEIINNEGLFEDFIVRSCILEVNEYFSKIINDQEETISNVLNFIEHLINENAPDEVIISNRKHLKKLESIEYQESIIIEKEIWDQISEDYFNEIKWKQLVTESNYMKLKLLMKERSD